MMGAAGLFSLSILNTLNLERNVMEHEYRIPDPARARGMIDVGRLLLLATQRMGEYVAYECLAGSAADPSQVYDHEGTEVRLLNPVRSRNGGLLPGIEIDERPVWTFSLRHQHREKWGSLLAPLVQLSASRSGNESAVVYDDQIQVSMRITLPRHEQRQVRDFMDGRGRPVLDYSTFAFGFDPESRIGGGP